MSQHRRRDTAASAAAAVVTRAPSRGPTTSTYSLVLSTTATLLLHVCCFNIVRETDKNQNEPNTIMRYVTCQRDQHLSICPLEQRVDFPEHLPCAIRVLPELVAFTHFCVIYSQTL